MFRGSDKADLPGESGAVYFGIPRNEKLAMNLSHSEVASFLTHAPRKLCNTLLCWSVVSCQEAEIVEFIRAIRGQRAER